MIHHLLRLAASVAELPSHLPDHRTYRIGAIGLRRDGVIVSARNGTLKGSEFFKRIPSVHAEVRCLRKMDHGATLYVARILADGSLALARPCKGCHAFIAAKRVRKVIYSISDNEYGVLML